MAVESVSVFFSYSHKDEALRNDLDVHLAPLRRGKLISSWHDRKIAAGTEWDAAIAAQLQSADIIVLLLSPDFLASDYCNDKEIPSALARHESGDAIVIPVVLRPFNWFNSPVAHLQSIPRDKKAVTTWADRDEAFVNVAEGIREEANRMLELRRQQALQRDAARQRYQMKVVEMLSDGQISLVERETLDELQAELKLMPAEAAAIEAKAAEPYKKYDEDLERYRRTLLKVIEQQYPIGEALLEDLKLRRRDLGLKDEDADRIEAPILAQAEARHQARQAAPAPAPTPIPAPVPVPPAAPPTADRVPPPAAAPAVAPVRAAEAAAPPAAAPDALPPPPPPRTEFGDIVLAALAQVGPQGDLFVVPDLPAAKLANARRSCAVPADDEVLGLVDLTVFGSATDALLLGHRALYYHNDAGTPKAFGQRWTDLAAAEGGFVAKDSSHILCPDGTELYFNCAFKTELAAALLEAVCDTVRAELSAGAGAAGDPAGRLPVESPLFRGPADGTAGDKAYWEALFADLQTDLNQDVERLMFDTEVGSAMTLFARAGDAQANFMVLFIGSDAELLLGIWGNKDLPSALSLPHPERTRLTDEFGFGAISGEGLAFGRGFGPIDKVDPTEVAGVLMDVVIDVFKLPRGELAVGWVLSDQ